MRGDSVVASRVADFGVRDAAAEGGRERFRDALRRLLDGLLDGNPGARPELVAAAGMITSELGLAEIPHVPAPATARELAAGALRMCFPELTPAPVWLFPGVRWTGPDLATVEETDLMRGEETLCVGLLVNGRARAPFALLHLGSHWKWIEVDAAGRIAHCRTTLSGELLHAICTRTVLSASLPAGPPAKLDPDWCERGMARARRSGLARALFAVRLLEVQGRADAAQRLAFVLGALVAADETALARPLQLPPEAPVLLEGWSAAVQAWRHALAGTAHPIIELTEADRDASFLAGLHALVRQAAG